MNKRVVIAATIAAAALALTGCAASTDAKTGPGQVTSKLIPTVDGGNVECVFWVPVDGTGYAEAQGAQMDCNWEGANR
jgi:outer membrane lipoprotein SlyB